MDQKLVCYFNTENNNNTSPSIVGNWLGILSRGILLPKLVTTMGVQRTDAGQLGLGIYFAPFAKTSAKYSTVLEKKKKREVSLLMYLFRLEKAVLI